MLINKVADDNNKAYILEVDLEYLLKLHNLHADYSLAPENIKITSDVIRLYKTIT